MKLAGIFGNRMVLQRDRENHIFGHEDKADKVEVSFEGNTYTGNVTDGKFDVVIPPTGVRLDVDITVRGSDTVVLREVCFGDVFLLSGQSNMQLPVYRTFDVSYDLVYKKEYPYIREYVLNPARDYLEDDEYELPDTPWICAVPGQVENMSAYGFYTFRNLYESLGIPFGLILNAQGGSTVEAWLPEEDIKQFPDLYKMIEEYRGRGVLSSYLDAQEKRTRDWRDSLRKFDENEYSKSIPAGAIDVDLPRVVDNITGSVWFFKEITLNSTIDEPGAFVYMGRLIDADNVYINGKEIGSTGYQYPPRKYKFDASVLQEGKNIIAVRLIVERRKGAFVPYYPYYLEYKGERIELNGRWKMIRECPSEPYVPGKMLVEFPSLLYKSSIYPVRNVTLKGIMWYQGESNSGDPLDYDKKFAVMVDRWRKVFGGEIPVLTTELVDTLEPLAGETEVPSGWREIQRQQREAEQMVPDCRCVRASDLGQVYELHPQRKKELGDRASAIILNWIY